MKKGLLALALLLFVVWPMTSEAKKDAGLHTYFAFGGNLTPADSVRIGWNKWELGKIHPVMYGVSKILPIDPTYYTSLGFGLMGSGFGINASIGFNYDLFWSLGLRGEIFAAADSTGLTFSHGLIGISWNF